MRNTAKQVKTPLSVRLLNIVIVLLLVIAVFALAWMISEIRSYSSRDRYGMIAWYAEEGNYGEMVSVSYRNAYDVEPFRSVNETAYEVALYADAAFQHLYFDAAGEESLSALFAERMAKVKANTGDLAPLTEDIDSIISKIRLYP